MKKLFNLALFSAIALTGAVGFSACSSSSDEVIDNPNCLIDIADIVLVDPVATGYGALLDDEKGKEFFGIEQDAEAF